MPSRSIIIQDPQTWISQPFPKAISKVAITSLSRPKGYSKVTLRSAIQLFEIIIDYLDSESVFPELYIVTKSFILGHFSHRMLPSRLIQPAICENCFDSFDQIFNMPSRSIEKKTGPPDLD
jgi:hypothetical protein